MSQSTQKLKEHVGGQVATTPYEQLRVQLLQRRNDFALLLGKNVDKFIQVVLTAVTKTPELLGADRTSLVFAAKAAAIDKLMPDGKDAAFVIYNTKVKKGEREVWIQKVQYLPMVRGLVKLLWDTGELTYLDAAAVYERDAFRFARGDSPVIEHTPYAGDEDPGKVVAAYVIAKLKTGETKREVMFRRDIERARSASKNSSRGPWVDWYDQMAIKTVLHRAYKQLQGVPDDIEGVFERDMAQTLSGGMSEVLELPEQAGGEPVPQGASAVGRNQAEPDHVAAQAETAGAETGNQASAAPNDPGASQEPTVAELIAEARSQVVAGEFAAARDLVKGAGTEAINVIEAAIKRATTVGGKGN